MGTPRRIAAGLDGALAAPEHHDVIPETIIGRRRSPTPPAIDSGLWITP
ncbi:hypothetical protein ACH47B_26645 [Rhodococcus sp. NPDC019627]